MTPLSLCKQTPNDYRNLSIPVETLLNFVEHTVAKNGDFLSGFKYLWIRDLGVFLFVFVLFLNKTREREKIKACQCKKHLLMQLRCMLSMVLLKTSYKL